jgi:hypothetical protein
MLNGLKPIYPGRLPGRGGLDARRGLSTAITERSCARTRSSAAPARRVREGRRSTCTRRDGAVQVLTVPAPNGIARIAYHRIDALLPLKGVRGNSTPGCG